MTCFPAARIDGGKHIRCCAREQETLDRSSSVFAYPNSKLRKRFACIIFSTSTKWSTFFNKEQPLSLPVLLRIHKETEFQASIIRTSQARILFIHQHLLSDKNDELREHESLRHEPLKHEYLRHARSKNRRRRQRSRLHLQE
jgi:hypothetical protein